VLNNRAASLATARSAEDRRHGAEAASLAERGINLNSLSVSSTAACSASVAAPGSVVDVVEHRVIVVEDRDDILGAEEAARGSAAVSFLGGHDGLVPEE
jgi:hypothetical protein